MNRETRILRPFRLRGRLDHCLDSVRLRFGPKHCQPDEYILVNDRDEYLRSVPCLSWAEDQASFGVFKESLALGLVENGIEADAAALVVTAYTGYLKITDILIDHPVSRLDALERESRFHPDRPKALRASTHGATVTAYLVLIRELKQAPLVPWRKGTWLARAEFRIRRSTTGQIFRLTPMTKEKREELRLPKDCFQYLHMGDHEPLLPYADTSPPIFYVDADLLTRLGPIANTAVGKIMQIQLVRDFTAAVIMDIVACDTHDVANRSWDDLRDSLFGRIVRLAAGKSASAQVRRRTVQIVQSDPGRLVALVEDALKLRQSVAKAFSEGL